MHPSATRAWLPMQREQPCAHTDTPPCETRTVYVWRISQGALRTVRACVWGRWGRFRCRECVGVGGRGREADRHLGARAGRAVDGVVSLGGELLLVHLGGGGDPETGRHGGAVLLEELACAHTNSTHQTKANEAKQNETQHEILAVSRARRVWSSLRGGMGRLPAARKCPMLVMHDPMKTSATSPDCARADPTTTTVTSHPPVHAIRRLSLLRYTEACLQRVAHREATCTPSMWSTSQPLYTSERRRASSGSFGAQRMGSVT